MEPSKSHIIVQCTMYTVSGPEQYNTNMKHFFRFFDVSSIKLLINTREKQELPVVEAGILKYQYLYYTHT